MRMCLEANREEDKQRVAEIVADFGVPHTLMFPTLVAGQGPQSETAQLFREVAEQLRAVQPDVLVVFEFRPPEHVLPQQLSDHVSRCDGPHERSE